MINNSVSKYQQFTGLRYGQFGNAQMQAYSWKSKPVLKMDRLEFQIFFYDKVDTLGREKRERKIFKFLWIFFEIFR